MSTDDHADARFMDLALALGRRGLGRTWPNPAIGAVVVKDGVVIGRGWTQPGGRPHAETEAIKQAGAAARDATLYVTLEPCSHHGKTPPCADAIVVAGIARVVSALEDPNPDVTGQGHARLRAAGIDVTVGTGADQARRAHAGHLRRVCDGRPHVTLKLAISADGKAGLSGRRPAAITGDAVRAQVHRLRAMNDAVLTGIGTVMADDPLLTCRLPGMESRSPIRVVLDSALRLPLGSKLVASAAVAPVWAVTSRARSHDAGEGLQTHGVSILHCEGNGRLDLLSVLRELSARGITRLLVESGPIVAASFVAADLVDEAMVFHAPMEIGNDGIDALAGMPLTRLTQSPALHLHDVQSFGKDRCEHYERA